MSITTLESALVVLAPEADTLVKAYRDRWDPAAALGVPAHITVLYPFHPPPATPALASGASVAPPVSAQLAALFAEHSPFDYALTGLGRFPGVLYLAPEPAEPFRLLTLAVVEAFPDYPPYGGKFDKIIPHMTLAEQPDPEGLEQIARDFQAMCGPRLPLRLRAEAVVLLDNVLGAWRVSATFQLGR